MKQSLDFQISYQPDGHGRAQCQCGIRIVLGPEKDKLVMSRTNMDAVDEHNSRTQTMAHALCPFNAYLVVNAMQYYYTSYRTIYLVCYAQVQSYSLWL